MLTLQELLELWDELLAWWPILVALADLILVVGVGAWVLMTKTDATSAVAWCLLLLFLPFVGAIVFWLFGYQHVSRPLKRKRQQKEKYRASGRGSRGNPESTVLGVQAGQHPDTVRQAAFPLNLAGLAQRLEAYPLRGGNKVTLYHEGPPAFEAMLKAIRNAKHHVHLMTFIYQPDETGQAFVDALAERARAGVQVRLLYDAMGCIRLNRGFLTPLKKAGGKCCAFLPLNPLRKRSQVNLRNHRKIMVADGRVGFVGGLNIGDEYAHKSSRFGYWRDTHLRLEGPSVADLQDVFAEDWDFAANEHLADGPEAVPGLSYFKTGEPTGSVQAQVIQSGPDQTLKSIREVYFAAILAARQRLWIASPYFVPDSGLLDALRLAGNLGVDVRLLCQFVPDKWVTLYAARYYWPDMLAAGVKVYQYTKGMMHSKILLVDGKWASVGTANLDNRSLHLNFEVNCLFYSPSVIAELEDAFERDLADSIRLEKAVYARRPFAGRLVENACRLLSPIL